MNNPLGGAGYLLRGLKLITRPGLRRFVIIPLTLNIALFVAAIWIGYEKYEDLLAWLNGYLPDWLSWLSTLLLPLLVITALAVVFFTFSLFANLIASPFNGLLAEKVEEHLTGKPIPGGGWAHMVKTLVPTLVDEVKKILYAVVWSIPFLVLFLIPGINLAAPFLWLAFTAWIMALQYGDYPMGNHGLKGPQIRARLRQRRFLALGFGGATVLLTSIPVVNFVAMPAAVAGATAMWVDKLRDLRQTSSHPPPRPEAES